jgi:hypothetical protein
MNNEKNGVDKKSLQCLSRRAFAGIVPNFQNKALQTFFMKAWQEDGTGRWWRISFKH